MKNKISFILAILAGVILLNSCLKDDEFDNWKEDVTGQIFATIASPGFHSKSVLPIADPVTIDILVNIATDAVPNKAYTINLALDNDAIAAYVETLRLAAIATNDTLEDGTLNYKHYKPWPSVVLNTPSITIPAGRRNGYAKITVDRADTVQLTGAYMVALTITSTSDGLPIAANMKTALYALPIANQYEGNYSSEGFRDHPTLGLQPFSYPKLPFTTVNANTVHKTQVGNYSGYGLDITITDEVIVINGNNCYKCTLKVTKETDDPGTDWGQYDTYDGQPINYYNPATQTFELYYWYNAAAPRKLRETNTKL